MQEQKPELDDYTCSQRNLEEYTKRLWQQRVKTETVDISDDIDEQGGYSPSRENYSYFDSYYSGDTDTFREHLDYSLKRSAEDRLSPTSSTLSIPTPTKRGRGRPYKEVSVKITCLRPEDNKASSLTVDFAKLQDEGLGVPKSELSGGIRSSSKLPLVWSAEDLRTHILKTFPRVINFRYMKCNQGKNLEPLPQEICPRDLRDLLGRSGLYIVPIAPLLPKESVLEDLCKYASTTTSTSAESTGQYWNPPKVAGEKVSNEADEFRITLDVSCYSPEEITVKTKHNRVVVHAKHDEREDEFGLIEREFKRQYILPKDVDASEVTSSLSPAGELTLKAPKLNEDSEEERIIPIQFSNVT